MADSNTNTNDAVVETAEQEQQSTLYYIYSVGCGFCKKAEPLVDELISEGYDILKLDLAESDNQKLVQELKTKYGKQCGTPLFIDGETGNSVCGYREKDMIETWAKGEEVPEPPRPNGPPPRPPENWDDNKVVDAWKADYTKWREDNKHVPNIPPVEQTLERVKKQQEMMKQRQAQQGQMGTQGPANLGRIEKKLDALIKHLGVNWVDVPTPPMGATQPPAAAAPPKTAVTGRKPASQAPNAPPKSNV